jgi:hypothetical protein
MKLAYWVAAAICSWLPATLLAAGNYAVNFDNGQAQNWTNPSGAWTFVDGYYRNSSSGVLADNAIYTGTTWGGNYTITARLHSEFGSPTAPGNRVGIVFGYVDSSHYFRLVVNTLGAVEVQRANGGNGDPAPVPGATGQLAAPPAPEPSYYPGSDKWFTVQVAVNGTSVSASVNGEWVLNSVSLAGLATGQVGLSSMFNFGRFDDFQVGSAKLIFKSGYEGPAVVVDPPSGCSVNPATSCWQFVNGRDAATGFKWPISLWTKEGRYQLNDNFGTTPPANRIVNQIQTVTGPAGSPTQAMYQSLEYQTQSTDPITHQDPYIIPQIPSSGPQGDIYIRQWFKLPDLANNIQGWRVLWQWKTGGDYRVSLSIENYARTGLPSGTPYWRLSGDNDANGPAPVLPPYWDLYDTTHPVPSDQWFKLEVFWHRGSQGDPNGRVWVAANGQQLFNYTGNLWGADDAWINRVMVQQLYTRRPAKQYVDDVEIWDGFPADASPH